MKMSLEKLEKDAQRLRNENAILRKRTVEYRPVVVTVPTSPLPSSTDTNAQSKIARLTEDIESKTNRLGKYLYVN